MIIGPLQEEVGSYRLKKHTYNIIYNFNLRVENIIFFLLLFIRHFEFEDIDLKFKFVLCLPPIKSIEFSFEKA